MATPFGPYQLLRRIASGGMGEVYLAVLERGGGFSKTVALKTILPQLAERPDFAARFQTEAATAALLNHPNIVQVFDHGQIEGRSFLTMEYVEGPDLAGLIAACAPQPFPPDLVVELGVQLCRALGHAHARVDLEGRPVGIVHGDVSPSNVLLSKDGVAKLVDFGLARLAADTDEDRAVAGKIAYMSPEQAAGQVLSPASDLFSLGLVLFELLTGRRAFEDAQPDQVLTAIRAGQCPSLERSAEDDLPAGLCQAVDQALQADPAMRPSQASDLAAQLSAACTPAGPEALAAFLAERMPDSDSGGGLRPEPTEVADQPVSPAQPDAGGPDSAFGRHWKWGLLFLVVLSWGAGLGWWLLHDPPSPRPDPPARSAPAAPTGLSASAIPAEPVDEPATDEPADGPTDGGTAAVQPDGRTERDRPQRRVVRRPPVAQPAPRVLGVSLPDGFAAQVDHRPVADRQLGLAVARTHLIKLVTRQQPIREVMLRLQPPSDGQAAWRLSVRSKPWMRIRLGGRPGGQTPRAGLRLAPGEVVMELLRDGQRIQIGFDVPVREAVK